MVRQDVFLIGSITRPCRRPKADYDMSKLTRLLARLVGLMSWSACIYGNLPQSNNCSRGITTTFWRLTSQDNAVEGILGPTIEWVFELWALWVNRSITISSFIHFLSRICCIHLVVSKYNSFLHQCSSLTHEFGAKPAHFRYLHKQFSPCDFWLNYLAWSNTPWYADPVLH